MRDHFIIMKKLMKKKMKNALIVRSYFEQKWISPVIEIMYMKKSKSTSVITVKKSFQKEAILKDILTDFVDNIFKNIIL